MKYTHKEVYIRKDQKEMSKLLQTTTANVFFEARKRAATHNESLNSRESAASQMSIDRGRLFRIESGLTLPHPEEVHLMAGLYDAPEIRNYYCANSCPLGCNFAEAKVQDLDRISLKALSIFRRINDTQDKLLDIAEDGRVTEEEKEDMEEVLRNLEELEEVAQNLKLWVAKNQKQKGGVSP